MVLLEGQTAPGLPFLRQLHWIVTPDPASEKDVARLFDAASGGGGNPGELWRYTSPYRGLEAMEEKDSDYFFGRKRETVEVLSALAGAPDRLPVLIGNSGVGKSSLAQAGVLAALKRQAWPEEARAPNAWPAAFQDSRQWCFLSLKPGTDPLKALVELFLDTWQFAATDPERVKQQNGWIELLRDGKATLPDLIDATERRRKELDQPKPPGFFLYVDQGEELYVRAEEQPAPALFRAARAGAAGSAPARDDEHALRLPRPSAKRQAAVQGPPAHRRAAAARGGVARDRQPPGATALGAVRDRRAHRHHHPAHRRGFDQGRGRLAAALLHARRHVDADGAAEATACCACRRNPSSLAACWSTAPTSFWRPIRAPRMRCGAC